MKTLLIVVAIIAVLVAVIWFAGAHFLNSSALDAADAERIASHFPPHGGNETAKVVDELAVSLPDTPPIRAAISEHLSRVIATGSDAVDAPPAALAGWLAAHATEIRTLQQQLVTRESPQWAVGPGVPLPRLVAHMKVFRVLSLDALEQHRAGNGAMAWNDLQASWKLAQGLLARPELISQLIAIAGARMSNGVAAKLSAPAPAWRHELASFDFGGAAVAAMGYESTESLRSAPPHEGVHALRRRFQAGLALESQRQIAKELASSRACDPHPRLPRGTPNIAEAWRRIGRFRAEVEGVEKLLALKAARAQSGSWPQFMPSIESSSCSDGRWRYRREADGSMSLAFSKPIAVASSQTTVVPLAFRYGR